MKKSLMPRKHYGSGSLDSPIADYIYARHLFARNVIRKSELKYYKGEVPGTRTPHGIPKTIWKRAYRDAKKHNEVQIK